MKWSCALQTFTFFEMCLWNAKLTAHRIVEARITQRSCPLFLPRLSSRGDFLVRLRLANLRPDWQHFKSTWAVLELGYINSVTWNRRKRGCSCLGPNLKLLTWPWSFWPNSPWICTQGIPKPSPPTKYHPEHTQLSCHLWLMQHSSIAQK